MIVVLTLLATLLVLILLRPATAIGSCCCGQGGSGGAICCVVCRLFSTLAREYTMTVAGITNDLCPNFTCDQLNGSFTLRWHNAGFSDFQGEACLWRDYSLVQAACNLNPTPCYTYGQWHLGVGEVTPDVFEFRLQPVSPSDVYYMRAATDWNCTGSNIMTRQGGGPIQGCQNYPATITVTAGASRVSECQCYPPFDAYATLWRLSFAGIGGCCSPEINDTFLLPFGTSQFDQHCTWRRVINSDCPSSSIQLILTLGSGKFGLEIRGSDSLQCLHAFYWMRAADFNPVGPNTLTRSDTDCGIPFCFPQCTNWPDTLVVQPV